jgi:SAM-dependent methyltransferase
MCEDVPDPCHLSLRSVRSYDRLFGEGARMDRNQHGRDIRTVDDVLRLLDGLFAPEADRWTAGAAAWWDGFYADRSKPVPFFVAKPDENLVRYLDQGLIPGARAGAGPDAGVRAGAGRALDLGCGPGRNALQLGARGFEVDGVDLSPAAVAWAEERARERGVGGGEGEGPKVRFHCGDVFALTVTELPGPYDLVYDSGCFHHLPPHRRISYLALLDRVLAPGGHFALTCFAAGGMGSELPDADLYGGSGLQGGLAYTPDELRWIFGNLEEVELRRMRDEPAGSPCFGEDFLWTALFRRAPEA